MAAIEILYYGRLRDEIGLDREPVELPSHILTVQDLLGWLRQRGNPHASSLAAADRIGAAIGGEWVRPEDSLFGAVEIVLFPPRGVL